MKVFKLAPTMDGQTVINTMRTEAQMMSHEGGGGNVYVGMMRGCDGCDCAIPGDAKDTICLCATPGCHSGSYDLCKDCKENGLSQTKCPKGYGCTP